MRYLAFFLLSLALGTAAPAQAFSGRVTVIDGDTLDVGNTRVRIFGIDAPEIGQPCTQGGTTWDCGRWARAEVIRLFQGQTAECQPVTRDRYGRVVARCTVEKADIGAQLVAEGLALAYRRYALDYLDEEKAALFAGLGIWRGAMQSPAAFRSTGVYSRQLVASDCAIKGNIGSSGKIYHLPGQEHYADTRISAGKGERWFCSEAAARAAGWRKARR